MVHEVGTGLTFRLNEIKYVFWDWIIPLQRKCYIGTIFINGSLNYL